MKIIFVLSVLTSVESTLSKTDNKLAKKSNVGKSDFSVYDRNLVVSEVQAKSILAEYENYYKKTGTRRFNGTVLGYVTPWNNHGYDVAKIFREKLDYVSPVWLQIKPHNNSYVITGTHDIDNDWLKSVRGNGERIVNIVPRYIFDGWSPSDLSNLIDRNNEVQKLSKVLVNSLKKWKFNGLVLEVWSQFYGIVHRMKLLHLVEHIALTLKQENLKFILVVPPYRGNSWPQFNKDDFDYLYDYVDAFSLMTYDYSNPQKPGPNSPIEWVKSCIETVTPGNNLRRGKLLVGLNFYGNAYSVTGGGPIINHEYTKLLKSVKGTLQFDGKSKEHVFEVRTESGKYVVFYPTLYSIDARINLAKEMGTGISIWELGQGLDYFYDLL